ncbi:manganese transporter [Longibacter salinarum]|uniref:Manganese transporter n=1 Tax=Longibacter salinarum TaxID=1850348 RepID=A0A2A8CXI9_9BACT|nr:zinc ABC transporter substrate-binding protein [Longibacter salinarum]PEN13415.1 manganese transporter [Longibacter salinarum]
MSGLLRLPSSLFRVVMMVIVSVFLWTGCVDGERSENDNPRVVATTSILADLVRSVGGDSVSVEGLMGPGVDPHLYKASEGDVTAMASADLIVYNGLDLEGKMTDVFAEMKQRGQPTTAVAREAMPDSLLLSSPDYAGNFDPHVWMDAQLWARAARHVSNELAAIDTARAQYYRNRAAAYADTLNQLDVELKSMIQRVQEDKRVLITSHDAFRYFGRAYGFEVRGLQGISTASEAGTADVQNLATFVAEREIPAIFVESSIPRRGIEAVREAVRAKGFDVAIGGTLYGDALGSPGTPAESYTGMLRSNVKTVTTALSPVPADTLAP